MDDRESLQSEVNTENHPPPLAALWSRDVASDRLAGRPRTILSLRRAMSEIGAVEHLRLSNMIEQQRLGATLWAICTAAGELLRGRLPSLQCLLFADGGNHGQLRKRLQELKSATLYCDGVRSYYFLRRLNAATRETHIVVDLDDLMSRRMDLLRKSGLGLSLGYLHGRVPAWVVRLLKRPLFAYLIASWEHRALRQAEDDLGKLANAVVLVSPSEGDALASRYARNRARADIAVIPPPSEIAALPQKYPRFERFIFIGSDTLLQNHSTISRLIELWSTLKPSAALHIYGSMNHRWPDTDGIEFRGYAQSLSDVYTEGAVLLAPGLLRGGVKIKVIEAFANGCAVVGNSVTFEGLGLEDYPLLFEDEGQIGDLIRNPQIYLEAFRKAAFSGQELVARAFGWNGFSTAWRAVLTPGRSR